jgi:hypothetical protein
VGHIRDLSVAELLGELFLRLLPMRHTRTSSYRPGAPRRRPRRWDSPALDGPVDPAGGVFGAASFGMLEGLAVIVEVSFRPGGFELRFGAT